MNIRYFYFSLITLTLLFTSCKKESDTEPDSDSGDSSLKVSSTSRDYFYTYGNSFTIYGENFSADTSTTSVTLEDVFGNTVTLYDTASTDTSIIVAYETDEITPGHYSIKVASNGKEGTLENAIVIYEYNNKSLTYIDTVVEGTNAGRLTIKGSLGKASFSGVDSYDYSIEIVNSSGTLVSESTPNGSSTSNSYVKSLSFTYPTDLGTGPFYVRVNYKEEGVVTPYYFMDISTILE
jgi:hypothetical protein